MSTQPAPPGSSGASSFGAGGSSGASGTPAREQMRLGNRYVLTEPIARGGMGEVWAASDEVLGRTVAIKILRRELGDDPVFRERFRAEARHAAGLSHPGIAAVYDYDDGTADLRAAPFLVMEYVRGEPLSTVIFREGVLAPLRTLELIARAADALQAAHDGGVIHRDIKPGNLIVTPDDGVKITDFGISRATNSVPLTLTGAIMGTAYYISPEQASGGSVTPASDIYSLGIVAYECLTGRRPFDGDTPVSVALAQVREEPPALPVDVPAAVRDLVVWMLAKDPGARPANAAHVARAARSLVASEMAPSGGRSATDTVVITAPASPRHAGEPAHDPRTDTDPTFVLPPLRRRRRRYLVLLVAVTVLLGWVAVSGADDDTAPKPLPPTASATPSPTVSQTPLVTINEDALLGRPADDVRAELVALGLLVDLDDAETPGPPGTVASVSPEGEVPRGTLITVTVVRAIPQIDDKDDDKDDQKRDDEKKKDEKKKDNGKGDD